MERRHKLNVPVPSPWPKISETVKHENHSDTTSSTYYICHGDLLPRNIMVEVLSDKIATIPAILDW